MRGCGGWRGPWALDRVGGGAGGCRGRTLARIQLHGSQSLIEGFGLLGHRDLQGGIGEWIPHALFSRPWPVGDPLRGSPLPLGLRQSIHSKNKITSAKHWNKQKRKQIPRLKKNLFFCSGRPSIPGCFWPASPLGGAWSSGRRGLRVADGAMLDTCRDRENERKQHPPILLPHFHSDSSVAQGHGGNAIAFPLRLPLLLRHSLGIPSHAPILYFMFLRAHRHRRI